MIDLLKINCSSAFRSLSSVKPVTQVVIGSFRKDSANISSISPSLLSSRKNRFGSEVTRSFSASRRSSLVKEDLLAQQNKLYVEHWIGEECSMSEHGPWRKSSHAMKALPDTESILHSP
mmetsp:Transcript_2525/g.3522  ORF Transcript_2525/g.3522 Transcript_2525/m.3522 type:complete len:119 (-) Transcript_2525:388-744(-)